MWVRRFTRCAVAAVVLDVAVNDVFDVVFGVFVVSARFIITINLTITTTQVQWGSLDGLGVVVWCNSNTRNTFSVGRRIDEVIVVNVKYPMPAQKEEEQWR